MREYHQHPLSAAFPGMSQSELAALTDDIAEEGQREPITLFEGKILDGWHRYQACNACGRVPVTVELPGGVNPVAFVKSRNLHRRHLTGSQRAAAVVACGEWAETGRPKNPAPGAAFPIKPTVQEMAKEAEVSPRTIQHAKTAHAAGMGGDVRDGSISAKAAAEIVKPKPAAIPELSPVDAAPFTEVQTPPTEAPAESGALIQVDKEEYNRLVHDLAETVADNEAMGKVFDSNDQLKTAMAEIAKLRARNAQLELRLNGIMAEKAEAIRTAKKWKLAVEKMERTAKTVQSFNDSGLPE